VGDVAENVETLRGIYAAWEAGDFTGGLSIFERNVTLVIEVTSVEVV
jgi:ketosteroid isomerase-like protein